MTESVQDQFALLEKLVTIAGPRYVGFESIAAIRMALDRIKELQAELAEAKKDTVILNRLLDALGHVEDDDLPPVVPAFLAAMTPDELQAFITKFNGPLPERKS